MQKLVFCLMAVLLFGHAFANGAASNTYMQKQAEVKLLLHELNNSYRAKRIKAEESIRAAIDNDLPDERGNSWYRIQLYSFGATMILQDTTVPFDVKQFIAEILAEGIANDPSRYLKEKATYWLAKVLDATGSDVLSERALDNIRKGYSNPELLTRDMIFLVYHAEIPDGAKWIEAASRHPLQKRNGQTDRTTWAALLVRAWSGDRTALRRLLEYGHKADDIERTTLLFKDISTINDQKCVEFFKPYLDSDERLPELKPGKPGEPVAAYAATALYKMLAGFPEPTESEFYAEEDIMRSRAWMKQQKEFKFRAKPLAEKQNSQKP